MCMAPQPGLCVGCAADMAAGLPADLSLCAAWCATIARVNLRRPLHTLPLRRQEGRCGESWQAIIVLCSHSAAAQSQSHVELILCATVMGHARAPLQRGFVPEHLSGCVWAAALACSQCLPRRMAAQETRCTCDAVLNDTVHVPQLHATCGLAAMHA